MPYSLDEETRDAMTDSINFLETPLIELTPEDISGLFEARVPLRFFDGTQLGLEQLGEDLAYEIVEADPTMD